MKKIMEPWNLTQDEFLKSYDYTPRPFGATTKEGAKKIHKCIVLSAISDGKNVPPEAYEIYKGTEELDEAMGWANAYKNKKYNLKEFMGRIL